MTAISKVRKSQLVQLSGSLALRDAHYVCGIRGDLPGVFRRFCWSCCLVLQPKYQHVRNRELWLSSGVLYYLAYVMSRSCSGVSSVRHAVIRPSSPCGRWEAAVSKINICKVLDAFEKRFVARYAIYVDGLQDIDSNVFLMPCTPICTSN